jgi:hypothetical protein
MLSPVTHRQWDASIVRQHDQIVMPGADPRSRLQVDEDRVRIQALSLPPATLLALVIAAHPVPPEDRPPSPQGEPLRLTLIDVTGTYDIDGETQIVNLALEAAYPIPTQGPTLKLQ